MKTSLPNQSGSISQTGAQNVPWITRNGYGNTKNHRNWIFESQKRTRAAPIRAAIAPEAPTIGIADPGVIST